MTHSTLRSLTLRAALLAAVLLVPVSAARGQDAGPRPMRLAIAGLVHGHVDGFARRLEGRTDVQLVGVFDRDPALVSRFLEQRGLPRSMGYESLDRMLDESRPDAVAAFTSTADHPAVVSAASRRHVHVMMEKPLAVSLADARTIAGDARAGAIHVIVNYETTWYPSLGATKALVASDALGAVRKMVAMDGHEGPKEINVQPEFLRWLTDPVQNGGGALFDFGCYGVNLMTWLMDGARPLSVRALTQQIKPDVYPAVDDEATIVLEYPKAQGIVQASWNWPFGRKDFEVYGARGYAVATGGGALRVRLPGANEESRQPAPLPAAWADPVAYLLAIVRGTERPSGPSSLENNIIVTEVLEAARQSAKTGTTVVLAREDGK